MAEKKKLVFLVSLVIVIVVGGMIAFGAFRKDHALPAQIAGSNEAEEGSLKKYFKDVDGTWKCDGYTYRYKLEITGKMENASADSTFVYLSNLEKISFEQAWKAAGLSSNTEDYFDVKDAVLVEWRME